MHKVDIMPTHLNSLHMWMNGLWRPITATHISACNPTRVCPRLRFNANVSSMMHSWLYGSHVSTVEQTLTYKSALIHCAAPQYQLHLYSVQYFWYHYSNWHDSTKLITFRTSHGITRLEFITSDQLLSWQHHYFHGTCSAVATKLFDFEWRCYS